MERIPRTEPETHDREEGPAGAPRDVCALVALQVPLASTGGALGFVATAVAVVAGLATGAARLHAVVPVALGAGLAFLRWPAVVGAAVVVAATHPPSAAFVVGAWAAVVLVLRAARARKR